MDDYNLQILYYHRYKFSLQYYNFDMLNVERYFKISGL